MPFVPPKAHSLNQVNIDEVFAFTCFHCYCLNSKITKDSSDFLKNNCEVKGGYSHKDQTTIEEMSNGKIKTRYYHKGLVELKEMFGDKIKINYEPIGWLGHDPGRLFFIAEENGKGHETMMMIFEYTIEKGVGKGMSERRSLTVAAKKSGIPLEFFKQMDNPRIIKKMENSIQKAKRNNISSTPTLIIEGKLITSGDFSNLVTIINALLKEPVK